MNVNPWQATPLPPFSALNPVSSAAAQFTITGTSPIANPSSFFGSMLIITNPGASDLSVDFSTPASGLLVADPSFGNIIVPAESTFHHMVPGFFLSVASMTALTAPAASYKATVNFVNAYESV